MNKTDVGKLKNIKVKVRCADGTVYESKGTIGIIPDNDDVVRGICLDCDHEFGGQVVKVDHPMFKTSDTCTKCGTPSIYLDQRWNAVAPVTFSVAALKEQIANLPDDTRVCIERVEDNFFIGVDYRSFSLPFNQDGNHEYLPAFTSVYHPTERILVIEYRT